MPRAEHGRGLRAVLFVDTVGSTRIAAELGDERWQRLVRRELSLLRHLLKEDGGREVDSAGDGLFALFAEPAAAVRYAAAATAVVREIGLEIRAGVHFGECEFAEGHPGGIVVHAGARTMSTGGAGEVIVTQTVRDLVSGGHLRFSEHGVHELKGVPGTWALFRLTQIEDEPVASPLGEEEASSRRGETADLVPVVRRRTVLAGFATAVAAGSIGTFLITRDKGTLVTQPSKTNRLFRFDPETGALDPSPVVFPETTSGQTVGIAVGEGGVWATDTVLRHLDPVDGTLEGMVEDITLGVFGSTRAVTTGFDDVWVASTAGLLRVDPADDEKLDLREFPGANPSPATGVAAGPDAVWVILTDGTLYRIAPEDGLPIVKRIAVGGLPTDLVIAGDAVWVADEFGDLVRIEPRTNRETHRLALGGTPKALAATDAHLWVVDPGGVLTVVTLSTEKVRRTIDVGGIPVDVASGLQAIWVADFDGRLLKVDEASLAVVDEVPVGGPVVAIAVDETTGLMWLRTSGESGVLN